MKKIIFEMLQQISDFLVPVDSEFDSESIGTIFGSFCLLEKKIIFFSALSRSEKNYFWNASADFKFLGANRLRIQFQVDWYQFRVIWISKTKNIFFYCATAQRKRLFWECVSGFSIFWCQSTQNSISSRLVPILGHLVF